MLGSMHTTGRPQAGSRASLIALVTVLTGAGIAHFAVPGVFDQIVPRILGRPRLWTYASGAAELVTAALLAVPRTRRVGAWAAVALFVAVFPANIQMAVDSSFRTDPARATVAWLRLPIQPFLILWAWSHARERQDRRATHP